MTHAETEALRDQIIMATADLTSALHDAQQEIERLKKEVDYWKGQVIPFGQEDEAT
jgi:molybdopterin synthase catalytic subunit